MVILCSFKLLSLHLIYQFDGLVKFLLLTFADEIIWFHMAEIILSTGINGGN